MATKRFLILALVGLVGAANANVFEFKDAAGFERCLSAKDVTDAAKPKRRLAPGEVATRCLEQGLRLAREDRAQIPEFVGIVQRNSAPENALDLVALEVEAKPPACNETANYEVLLAALARPRDFPTPTGSYYRKAEGVLRRCVKDAEFLGDIKEERESSNKFVRENVQFFFKSNPAIR